MTGTQQTPDEQINKLILELVRNEKPDTINDLITLVKQNIILSEKRILDIILELESENKIHLTQNSSNSITPSIRYIFSHQSIWYWITVALIGGTAISVLTIPEDNYPLVYARQILGVVTVLFLPGWVLIKALFPHKVPILTSSEFTDLVERIALGFGSSLALTSIVGLALNYTSWGINLFSIMVALFALTVTIATASLIHMSRNQNEAF